MTAFRTISMRIRGYDEETEEYIGNVEELTGKIADLTKTAKTPGGISLFTDETKTTYKSTYQLLKEISEIYSDLTDKQQAALLETLAGKRGGQVLAGILSPENFKEVERAMKEMSTAAGAAADEMGIVEQSLSFKLNSFKETWVSIWQSLIDRGTVGGVIDFLTDVSEGLDKIINTVGGGSALGMALEGVMMTQGFGFLQYNKDTGKMGGMLPSLWNVLTNKGTVNQSTSQFIKAFEMNAMNNLDAEAIDKLATSIGGVDKAVVDSAKGFTQSGQSIAQWRTQAMSAAGAGNALKGVLMSIGSIAGSMAIAWGISQLIEGTNALMTAQDHMVSAAKGYQSSIQGIESSMNSYKSQVASLSETLNSNDATTEQKVQARKDLISLQQKLIEEYGKEPGAISDINAIINNATSTMDGYSSAIDNTSEAWSRLAKSAIDSAKRSSDAQDSFWQKFSNAALFGTESSIEAAMKQYDQYTSGHLKGVVGSTKNASINSGFKNSLIGKMMFPDESIKEFNSYIRSFDGFQSNQGWNVVGNAEEVLEIYEKIYAKALATEGVNDSYLKDLRAQIDDIKNVIDNTAEYRNVFTEDLINNTQEYIKARESIDGLYDEYNNAIAENDLNLASTLKEKITSQLNDVEMTAENNADDNVKRWFESTYSEFQEVIDKNKFSDYLKQNGNQSIFDEALKGLEYDGRYKTRAATLEELQRMASLLDATDLTTDKGYTQKQIDSFEQLNFLAHEAGYSIQEVLSMLNQLNQVDTQNLQNAMDKFIPRNASDEYKQKMEEYLRGLESEGKLETALVLDVEVDKKNVDATIEQIDSDIEAALQQEKAYKIDFDMAGFLHGMEAVQTALTSTEGLTDDTVAELKNYFSTLEDFNPAKLFEETTRGIQVNHQELARLVKEMESVSYDQIVQQEKEVIEKYDSLMEAMSHMNKTSSEYADAQIQLDELREQSKLIGTLISQYDAATSAYKKFLNAQATPDQSAGYVAIASQYEEMKKLADAQRWGNDDLKAYLNIFSYEDTMTDSIEKQQELWKSLKETIDGTNKTKMDFFKLDSEGNVTINGAVNLAEAIKQKFGETYASLEDGMWTLDLTGGKFEEVAKGLNISKSALDLILDSLREFGFDVQRSVDISVDAVNRLGISTEEAQQKFKELGYNLEFDENNTSISQLNGLIKTLEIFANKNLTEAGEFDMNVDGMKEANVLLDELVRKRQELETQNMDVMNIDTSKMESGLQKTIQTIQTLETDLQRLELAKINFAPEADISQIKQDIINSLSDLGNEDLSQYVEKLELSDIISIDEGVLDESVSEIQSKLKSITSEQITGESIEVEATADTDGIKSETEAAVNEASNNEVKVGTQVDRTNFDSFKSEVANTSVDIKVEPIVNTSKITAEISSIPTQHINVAFNPIKGSLKSSVGTSKTGPSRAYGGAFAGGRALVGELGRELVVDPHNGRYQTVGDNGAEFVNLPKDAIVFNHWQTKRLFQGRNPGRGTAFAQGNAYPNGTGSGKEADIVWTMGAKTAFSDLPALQKQIKETAKIAKDATKDVNKSIDSSKDTMSTLSGQLDEIQSAYNSLKGIMETYNETGSITIDQAQELMQTDFRYLALLSDENGVLGLNEAGFESLAQAKLQEMQITMIRNAIDTVNSLTSEAAAADYLSNSYLNLGQSALSASQMTLQAAVNAAHARGAMQGAAADMISQGVNNAMTLMQNVGLNSGQKPEGGGGGGGGGGGAEDAAGTKGETKEQSVEKELDWIERLLERLTKLTKKWTDQAERFFSYWNKNWAIDKAIKSGRDEITNTNKAISYYMTKAGEVELEPEYVKLVQKGGLSTETIEDEELGEKIEEYQEWWDKIIKCREALQDLYDAERDMIFQKLSNILDYYDKIQEYYDSLTSKFESFLSMKSASGQRTTMKDLIDQYAVGIESLEQLQQKYWSYQTGLTGFTERSSSEVIADLKRTLGSEALDITTELFGAKYGEFYQQLMEDSVDNTVSGIEAAQSEAYENLLKRRQELQDKLDTYNNAVEEKKRLKSEDLKLARGDKDETNRVNQLIKEQEAIIKAYKLTSADKKGIKELDKEIAGWESILFSSSFYDTAYQTIHDYQDRAAKYEELLAQKNDKAYWKSLTKAEQKEITQGLKENKLSSKEKKNQQYLQSRVDMIDQIGDTFTVSRLYAENYLKRQELENRKNLYDVALENLGYIYEDLSTEYRDAKIKELKQDLKDAKKEFKSNKWTTKDNDLLRWLESQQEALDQLRDNLIVDSDTSQSANYKELINQIGNIQSKTKVTNADQKKLAMYLDELNEINSGVLEEDIVRFRNQYEKWWNLNDTLEKKGSLSREQNLQKKKLEDSMSSMREKYQDHVKALQDELLDSLMVEDPKNKEDLTQNYERTKKALEESYEKQLTASQDAYKNTNRYREIYASWDTRNQEVEKYQKQIEAAQKQGKNTNNLKKKLDKAIKARDKLRDELDALALGATEENIGNYIEAWSYVRAHREAYENGTWKGSNADTYDKYRKQLDDWNKEKEDATKAIRQEMTDKLKELDTEYHKNLADMETEQHEKLEKMWELAKQIAEWEASSLQSTIDQLDMMIQRYQALANMLANTNFESLKKYDGVMDLFGLDKAKSEIELIREQYEKAITMSNKKIQSSIDMANVYKKLLDAAQENDEEDPNNFKSILSEYYEAESTTDEMRQTMDSIIEMLNSNKYTANDWVTEWNDKMQEAINSVIDAVDNIQTLKDELRENVIFKSINEAIEQLDSLNSRLSSMANVIHDNWVIVGDTLTEYGLAKINLLGQQMQNSQKQVEQWAKKVKEIDRIVDEEDQIAAYGSTHQYLVARNEALENYYNALQSVESTAYEIYQLGKQADEARVNSLRNVAENYKSALDAKKSFYEYDKNIKSQTKDIEALKAQIEALNGVKVRPFYFNCGKILRVLTTKYI